MIFFLSRLRAFKATKPKVESATTTTTNERERSADQQVLFLCCIFFMFLSYCSCCSVSPKRGLAPVLATADEQSMLLLLPADITTCVFRDGPLDTRGFSYHFGLYFIPLFWPSLDKNFCLQMEVVFQSIFMRPLYCAFAIN